MTVRRALGKIKRRVAPLIKHIIIRAPVGLALQSWAIKWLLPMDPWPRSLAYQQCLADRMLQAYGPKSQAGPFKGMVCIRDADEGCLVPKLIGCYEEELIPTMEAHFKEGFDRFIDVGCASGYWLTGAAMKMPNAKCFGFDADEQALARCRELMALNGVQSRVMLFGSCTTNALEELIGDRTLLFMDCDGPEYDLLDPARAPALRKANIVVECHDIIDPRITPALTARFEGTHAIEKISSRDRTPDLQRYPALQALPPKHWAEALAERRPGVQDWLIMRPKAARQFSR